LEWTIIGPTSKERPKILKSKIMTRPENKSNIVVDGRVRGIRGAG